MIQQSDVLLVQATFPSRLRGNIMLAILSSDFLSTEFLSTEFLSTEFLSTEFLSTETSVL